MRSSRRLARREVLPRARHGAALEFVSTFWLVLVAGTIGLLAIVVIGMAVVDHRLLGSLPARGLCATIIGSMGLSMIAAFVAGTRKSGWMIPW